MFRTILNGGQLLLHLVLVSATTGSRAAQQRPWSTSYDLDYYSYPQLHWKSRLEGSTLETGNSVEYSPFDDEFIYLTTREANLVVLSASNGTLLTTITPSSMSINGNSAAIDHTTHCKSGMAFGTLHDGSPFLVYSVVYVPRSDGLDLGLQTRVVAISIPDHKELWASNALPGQNSGSPVLFKSKDQQTYIALTHNSEFQTKNNTVMTTGYITVLRAEDGNVMWTETESSWNIPPTGYSPPQVAHNPSVRKYESQEDIVVWASSDQEGTGNNGNIYAFQLPMDFDPDKLQQQQQTLNLTSTVLKDVRWTTKLSPVFGDGGRSMYMGVTADQLRGWVNNTPFDATATWTASLKKHGIQDVAAIPVNPTLSRDGERLFVSTSSSEGFCIDAKTGHEIWKFSGSSSFLAARVSPDDDRVYFFQAIDGRIFAYEQDHGALHWVTSCDAFEEDCSNSVLASFTLSRTGEYLVYSDVLGLVLSLKLGERVHLQQEETGNNETAEGSKFPQRPPPTAVDESQDGMSMGGSLALILLSVFVAISSAVSLVLIRQARIRAHRKVDDAGQQSMKEEDDDDNSSGTGFDSDPLEDSTIPNQIPDSLPKPPRRFSPWLDEVRDVPNETRSSHSREEGYMAAKVAPISDDYSLGASMLL